MIKHIRPRNENTCVCFANQCFINVIFAKDPWRIYLNLEITLFQNLLSRRIYQINLNSLCKTWLTEKRYFITLSRMTKPIHIHKNTSGARNSLQNYMGFIKTMSKGLKAYILKYYFKV